MGNGGSTLSPNELASLRKRAPVFSQLEVEDLLKRYASMDPSEKGSDGIPYDACIKMPEFTGNVFAPDVIEYYAGSKKKRIYPLQFLQICAMFFHKTKAAKKKEFLFELFDVDNQNVLSHDQLFRIYKLLFDGCLSDDHILALTYRALRHPNLANVGEITKHEFTEMVPDTEIQSKMTINFIQN